MSLKSDVKSEVDEERNEVQNNWESFPIESNLLYNGRNNSISIISWFSWGQWHAFCLTRPRLLEQYTCPAGCVMVLVLETLLTVIILPF